jgi:hypothetical protein
MKQCLDVVSASKLASFTGVRLSLCPMDGSWRRVGVFLRITIAFLILCVPIATEPIAPAEIAREILAPLLDPVKVATLKGDRPINARPQRKLSSERSSPRRDGLRGEPMEFEKFLMKHFADGREACSPWKSWEITDGKSLPLLCPFWVQSGAFPRISPTHHPDKRKAATPCITKNCGLKTWRRRRESNPRMTVLQTIALPLGYSAVIPKREAIE